MTTDKFADEPIALVRFTTPPPPANLVGWLVALYALLIVSSIVLSAGVLIWWDYWAVVDRSITGSVAISVGASALHYLRKLYKVLFQSEETSNTNDMMRSASAIYFFTRPLFACMFALLTVIGLLAGFLAISGPVSPTVGLVYVSMFLSFFAGFTGGTLIDTLEPFGQDLMGRLFPTAGPNTRPGAEE